MAGQRPKGYADWNPSPEVRQVLDQVNAVLVEYKDYLPLTNRQVFYRLVAAYGLEKTEQAYKRLCNYMTRARRARLIRFKDIRDDKVDVSHDVGWDGLEQFQESIRESADNYTLDRLAGQRAYVELWCEAKGMMPQMSRVADEYTIPVYSASGFLSVTATHDIATRVAVQWRDERRPTILLHVGDYDPSGESIFDTIASDSGLFVRQYTGHDDVLETMRVALTNEQVEEHGIETAPPKSGWTGKKGDKGDSRSRYWVGETAQAEAMPPDLLATTVREAIEEQLDLDVYRNVVEEEERQRQRLLEWLEDLS